MERATPVAAAAMSHYGRDYDWPAERQRLIGSTGSAGPVNKQQQEAIASQSASPIQNDQLASADLIIASLLVGLIIISIIGNCLVCVAIFTDRRLRKLGNAFIVSLAIADLFVSCLVMTFALCNDMMNNWIFGEWFCDVWISFDIMCCTASILNLCAISLDRFVHIKDCLLYNQWMTRKVAISAVIIIWFISALVSFVPINLGWHKPDHFGAKQVLPLDPLRAPFVAASVGDLTGRNEFIGVTDSSGGANLPPGQSEPAKLNYKRPAGISSANGLGGNQLAAPANLSDRADWMASESSANRPTTNSSSGSSKLAGPELNKPDSNPPDGWRRNQSGPIGGQPGQLALGAAIAADQANSKSQQLMPPKALPQCMLSLTPTYAIISSTISFYIPCIIMLGLYTKLFACARRHVRNIQAISKAPAPIALGGWTGSGRAASDGPSEPQHQLTSAPNRKPPAPSATKSLIALPVLLTSREREAGGGEGEGVGSPRTTLRTWLKFKRTKTGQRDPDAQSCAYNGQLVHQGRGAARKRICASSSSRTAAAAAGGSLSGDSVAGRHASRQSDTENSARCGPICRQSDISSCKCGQPNPRLSAPDKDEATMAPTVAIGTNAIGLPSSNFNLEKTVAIEKAPVDLETGRKTGGPELFQTKPDNNNNNPSEPLSELIADESHPFLCELGDNLSQSINPASSNQRSATCSPNSAQTGDDGSNSNKAVKINFAPSQQQQQQYSQQQQQQQQQQSGQLATHKAAITLGIIMGTFLFCWVPFFCLNIIKAFCVDCIPGSVFRAFTWLGYANSALNPIIYGIHNSEFRNAFNRIFFKHLNIKNSRYYLNRRSSYDLRHANHQHRHHQRGRFRKSFSQADSKQSYNSYMIN